MSDLPSNHFRGTRRPADGARAASTPTQALDALLAGPTADPIRRALWLDELDRRLHALLPPELAAHARLANVDGTRLVYLVDSPVWHARLRMAATGLVDAARSIGLDVSEVIARTTSRPLWPVATQHASPDQAGTSALAGQYLHAIRTSLAGRGGATHEDNSPGKDPKDA
jgi:hypothetical protein